MIYDGHRCEGRARSPVVCTLHILLTNRDAAVSHLHALIDKLVQPLVHRPALPRLHIFHYGHTYKSFKELEPVTRRDTQNFYGYVLQKDVQPSNAAMQRQSIW